jgi:hypothetical protein
VDIGVSAMVFTALAGEIETALASIDHAVGLTERTGQRWNESRNPSRPRRDFTQARELLSRFA